MSYFEITPPTSAKRKSKAFIRKRIYSNNRITATALSVHEFSSSHRAYMVLMRANKLETCPVILLAQSLDDFCHDQNLLSTITEVHNTTITQISLNQPESFTDETM